MTTTTATTSHRPAEPEALGSATGSRVRTVVAAPHRKQMSALSSISV